MARIPRAVRPAYDVDSLTDVAVSVFSTRGYDATRMEHIARAANVSKSSLYHHVSNKEELLDHALRRAVGGLTAILGEPGAREGTPRERVEYVVRRTIAAELRYLPEVSLLLRVRGNSEVERWALDERRRYQERLVEIVREAQAAGEIDAAVDAGLYVRLVLGMSNSLVDWYRADGTWSARQIADAVVDLVLKPVETDHFVG
ncbi:MAG TPA: TetR/AcrR family transcriptional regulator [Acidimicrobiia bacterium]|nr:TetR/AcrR family transcriptional regulator [Acidimicrobiia bacterium]HKN91319.1 TetR/AcrR family transcriptional regulator [Acidimicrobiia bacterium]HMC79052.1 TetR/AcrR family transcriptional regulator [Acidimicrobiia bacterium]